MDYGYARASTKKHNEQRQAGHYHRKITGRSVQSKAKRKAAGISGGFRSVAQKGTGRKGSCRKARRYAQDISKMGRTGHTPLEKYKVAPHG